METRIKLPAHLAYLKADSDFSILPHEDLILLLGIFKKPTKEWAEFVLPFHSKDVDVFLADLISKRNKYKDWQGRIYVDSQDDCGFGNDFGFELRVLFERDFYRVTLEKNVKDAFREYENALKAKQRERLNKKDSRYEMYLKLKKEFEKP
jgi:hypothetical protein